MANQEELLEAIGGMTVLELSEFVDAFKEKFNVTAVAAPVAVAAAAAGGDAGGASAAGAEGSPSGAEQAGGGGESGGSPGSSSKRPRALASLDEYFSNGRIGLA